jgi:Anti-sigma-K factor rskA
MTAEDSRAQYLASGAQEGGESHDRLDLVRDVLSADATWAEPPPQVADGLLAALAAEAVPMPDVREARSGRWPLVLAGAGTLVAIAALVLGTISVIQDERSNVVAMSGTELEAAALGEAEFGPNEAGWWIRLDVTGLPPAPEGSYYEGWVWSDDGEGVSIGTFHLRGEDMPIVLWSGVPLADYPEIWVTLESEADGPEASELIVMTGRIPGVPEA